MLSSWIPEDLYNYLSLPTRAHLVWRCLERFLFGDAEGEDVRCRFCGGQDGNGHLFLGLYLSPLCPCA